MHYYKILKHNAGFDEGTNYWEKLLARYLAATGGGKIHATLPITFTSTSWKLVSWTIYGNNTPNNYSVEGTLPLTFTTHTAGNADDWSISGNDKVGKNLLPLTNYNTGGLGNVTYVVDEQSGTVTLNGSTDVSSGAQIRFIFTPTETLKVYFSGCPDGGGSGKYDVYCWDVDTNERCKQWDESTASVSDYGAGSCEATLIASHTINLNVRLRSRYTADNLTFKPMLRLPDTSADFEPYQVGVGQLVDDHFEIPVYSYPSNIPQIKKDLIGAKVHETQVTMRKGNETLVWDVIGIDHDEVYYQDGTRAQHSVTLQMHDVYTSLQFGARQALFTFPYGCPVGTYHFRVVDQPWYTSDQNKSMQFTLTKAIHEGGQLVINNNYNATMIGATISSYASPSTTTALESVTMSQGTGGTNLGDVAIATNGNTNSVQRALLGSANYQYSAMRQWLNSNGAAGSVWTPQTPFDRPPSWASNTAGFLNGIDADIQALIGECDKITALNTITDGGGSWTSREKVFLLSKTEVYGGNENSIAEGVAYPYYSDYSDLSAAGMGVDTNRTKYRNGSEQVWWVRSPDTSSAYGERNIRLLGSISSNTTNNTYGAAPAIVIPMDEIYNYHFNIGSAPLTAGQSISKASTGVDIAAIAGSNTITTDLYNKPEMSIEGVDYVGVGERTANLYNPDATDVNNGYTNPGRLRADGTINTGSLSYDIWVTEYIPVNAESRYTLVDLIATSSFGLCYYKNDKTYISGETYSGIANHGSKTVMTPADCKYIRFTTAENYDTMLVEGSTAPTTFIPYGYEIPLDIRHKTKNKFEITNTSSTTTDVIVTVDPDAGTVTSAGTPTAERYFYPQGTQKRDISDAFFSNGDILTCEGRISGIAFGINYYKSDGTFLSQQFVNNTASTVTVNIPQDAGQYRMIFAFTAGNPRNTTMYPMLRPADTSPEFEPYYLTNHEDIYIGDSPLTEGQTVSNTMEIEVFEGENTIDTTLYNKPEMEIIYE